MHTQRANTINSRIITNGYFKWQTELVRSKSSIAHIVAGNFNSSIGVIHILGRLQLSLVIIVNSRCDGIFGNQSEWDSVWES